MGQKQEKLHELILLTNIVEAFLLHLGIIQRIQVYCKIILEGKQKGL